jgi:hypothetical protein
MVRTCAIPSRSSYHLNPAAILFFQAQRHNFISLQELDPARLNPLEAHQFQSILLLGPMSLCVSLNQARATH